MTEASERARELLAAECAPGDALDIREGRSTLINSDRALRAIDAALASERAAVVAWLREQPSLVPVSPDHVRANSPQRLAIAIEAGAHVGEGA